MKGLDMKTENIKFTVQVRFDGVTKEERPPETVVYAFDTTGKLLTSERVANDNGKVSLSLPPDVANRNIRVVVGPRVEDERKPSLSTLTRLGAYEIRSRVDLQNPFLEAFILDPIWKRWLFCRCVVRGRLVKRVTAPDGTVRELPICHSRVTICEVDPLIVIIPRLPDDIIFRLRDELLSAIRKPIPIPDPPPFREHFALPATISLSGSEMHSAATPSLQSQETTAGVGQLLDAHSQFQLQALGSISNVTALRKSLLENLDLIRPYICLFRWLDPFYLYRVDCIKTVMVDENGRFETTIWYPCFGDKPDLYFSAEQLHGFVWQSIYRPSVRCNTHWDYACGSEIVINVTDPSAIPCAPEDPVDPPAGIGTWILPYAVGGTKIWGTPAGNPPAPNGWLRNDGLTDYGGIVNAPFGSTLGMRHGFSYDIPKLGIKYYRWSYRKQGTLEWKSLNTPVTRHYVKQSPAQLPTFPAYQLGPKTVGGNSNLFEFKPHVPPGPDPGDPAGTITYWPTDDFFGDIYSGFFETLNLPPNVADAAGVYQMKLEAFNSAGVQVMPGAGTFEFIVPSGVAPDGITTIARAAHAIELHGGAFIFNIHIDNNGTTASIDAPHIGATAVADDCGFLRYNPADSNPVTIAFHAQHPNNFATFGFGMVRGIVNVGAAGAGGEVAAFASGLYAGDGVGNFTHNFSRGDLLDTCVNAAFSENLSVYGKATNGWSRIGYDASAVRAFALAPEEP